MLRLNVLSGGRAGAVWDCGVFPVVIGRNRDANVCLEDEGVWDRHLEITLKNPDGFVMAVNPSALATVNDQPTRQCPLRNGDVIQIGPARIQFWLSGTRQINLRPREFVTWIGLAALCAAQIVLIYRFLH